MKWGRGSIGLIVDRGVKVFSATACRIGAFLGKFPRAIMVIVAFVSIYCYRNLDYIFDFHVIQNKCEFETVSNEQYVAMLSRAQRLAGRVWPHLRGSEIEIRRMLNERIDELSGENAGIYRRLAAMHAVMRQLNGYLSRVDEDSYDKKSGNQNIDLGFKDQSSIFFAYNVPSLSFGKFGLFFPEEFVSARITIVKKDGDLEFLGVSKNGDIGTSIIFTDIVISLMGKGFPLSGLPRIASQYPPLPPREWAHRFDEWANDVKKVRDGH